MRVPQYKPVRRYGFNMTPMIDVVFLLIIFFLVSSHLARRETQMELPLPVAQSGEEDVQQDVPRVTINVEANGNIWLGGRPVASNQLKDLLAAAQRKEGGQIEVRIRGSRQTAYANVEPIMLACTETGIWNVTYAVYNEEAR